MIEKPWFVPRGNPDGQAYQTPRPLFELLHGIFGFTVDAAASDHNALLPRYWTKEDNALKQDWSGEIVFCNPPFNNIAPFLSKARTAKKAVVLVPLNFLTSRSFGEGADSLIVPVGRVKFITGNEKATPILGTCFLIYGSLTLDERAAVHRLGWRCYANTTDRFIGKVFHSDALDLLRRLPEGSIDAVITDPMYGSSKICRYDWGMDPARGDPAKHWQYHQPLYEECRRVLKPAGVLAWAQGAKFCQHFHSWFGPHRLWTLTRFRMNGKNATGHTWIVQTKEQKPIEFPHRDSLVIYDTLGPLRKIHPCIKTVEEMAFMIDSLTEPGQVVLDCFCGLGSTLIAAQRLGRRWIGCDLSRFYSRVALQRCMAVAESLTGRATNARLDEAIDHPRPEPAG